MNRCETWNICPLGDITKYLKCRKPWCPKKTMADVQWPFICSGEMRQGGNEMLGKNLSKSKQMGKGGPGFKVYGNARRPDEFKVLIDNMRDLVAHTQGL